MKRIISTILVFVAFATVGFSQNARTILDKAAKTLTSSKGVSLKYTMQGGGYSQTGTLYVKGNKFKIDSSDGVVWFDGKTQWAYIKSTNEVNVSNPDGDELAAVSPVAILNLYKSGFSLYNKGTTTEGGSSVYKIEMRPQAKNSSVARYVLYVKKSSYQVAAIVVANKNGRNLKISITNYRSGLSLNNTLFVFDKKKYAGAEVVDLR